MVVLLQCQLVTNLARPCTDAEVSKLPSSHGVAIIRTATWRGRSYRTVAAACHLQLRTRTQSPKTKASAHAGKKPSLVALSKEAFKSESSIDQNLPGTCIFAIQKTLQHLVSKGVLIFWWEVRNEDTWNREHLAISFASFLHWEGSQPKVPARFQSFSTVTCRCYEKMWERNLLPCWEPPQLLE